MNIFFHIDADAFFASCEQATNFALRGKPVAIGRERGMVTALSYEAKALGVQRDMRGAEVAKAFPQVIFAASEYKKYSLFSRRLFDIVREHFPLIRQASVDECFALYISDHTDAEQAFRAAEKHADMIRRLVHEQLGITVSIGIGETRTIAKIASSARKPNGTMTVSPATRDSFLAPLPIKAIPGVGSRTSVKLIQKGIHTVGDFYAIDTADITARFHKPLQELHAELSGRPIHAIATIQEKPQSVSKIHSFSPATQDPARVSAELARNVESVAKKLRRENLKATHLTFGTIILPDIHRLTLTEAPLVEASNTTSILMKAIASSMDAVYTRGKRCRATYVCAHGLIPADMQQTLFAPDPIATHASHIDTLVDGIVDHLGGAPLTRASTLGARHVTHSEEKDIDKVRNGTPLLYPDQKKKPLHIINLGEIG